MNIIFNKVNFLRKNYLSNCNKAKNMHIIKPSEQWLLLPSFFFDKYIYTAYCRAMSYANYSIYKNVIA